LAIGLAVARYGSYATGPVLDRLILLLVSVAGLVCLFGAIDDHYRLSSRLKLLLQMVAVLPVVLVGCWVPQIWICGVPVNFGWLGIPLTICWLIGCINALNLLDGMDGLASLVGVSTVAMMGLIGVNEGHPEVAVVATVLAAALTGFLVYNLPPATIFLGDSGSMVIGLVVGLLGFQGNLKTPATLSITAPAVIMALPMLDVALAVIRRKLTGRKLDTADRQHIHHRLLDQGLTPWQVLCILGSLCLLTGTIAATATYLRSDALAWVTTLTLVVLAVRLRLLGHHEMFLLRHAMFRQLVRFVPRFGRIASHPELDGMEFDDLCDLLVDELLPWGLRRLEVRVLHGSEAIEEHHWVDPKCAAEKESASTWAVEVDFRRRDGYLCKLRSQLRGGQYRDLTPLVRKFQVFGIHFVACVAPDIYRSEVGAGDELPPMLKRRKAA
jgi:UDP-N-acetylmuramyl pentapeptide phosphotransferase/UDP-N-acetylglucosamine-1-phosphate transferase